MNRIYLSKRSKNLYWIKDILDNKRLGEIKIFENKTNYVILEKYQHQNIETESNLTFKIDKTAWRDYCHNFIELYNDDFLEIEDYNFPKFSESCRLHQCENDMFDRPTFLHPAAKSAWERMSKFAKIDGVNLQIISAFRSMDYQRDLIQVKLDKGQTIEEILKVNTLPGYSEHHTGCAIDIGSKNEPILEEEFEDSKAFKWLAKNANKFNFTMTYSKENTKGICYEPWHWCYSNPKQIKKIN